MPDVGDGSEALTEREWDLCVGSVAAGRLRRAGEPVTLDAIRAGGAELHAELRRQQPKSKKRRELLLLHSFAELFVAGFRRGRRGADGLRFSPENLRRVVRTRQAGGYLAHTFLVSAEGRISARVQTGGVVLADTVPEVDREGAIRRLLAAIEAVRVRWAGGGLEVFQGAQEASGPPASVVAVAEAYADGVATFPIPLAAPEGAFDVSWVALVANAFDDVAHEHPELLDTEQRWTCRCRTCGRQERLTAEQRDRKRCPVCSTSESAEARSHCVMVWRVEQPCLCGSLELRTESEARRWSEQTCLACGRALFGSKGTADKRIREARRRAAPRGDTARGGSFAIRVASRLTGYSVRHLRGVTTTSHR